MPKPICVPCQREYQIDTTGVPALERFKLEEDAIYKIWSSDRWRCPDCGHLLLYGFGSEPIAEHYETDFEDRAQKALRRDGGISYY